MHSNISGHTFIKKRRKTGVERGVWEKGVGLLMRGGGGRKFLMMYWGEGQKFSISHHDKMYHKPPITLTISDYFLFN